MDSNEPRFTDEQKRMGLVLLVVVGVIGGTRGTDRADGASSTV